MSFLEGFAKLNPFRQDPKELVRKWQRNLNKEQMKIQREIAGALQNTINKQLIERSANRPFLISLSCTTSSSPTTHLFPPFHSFSFPLSKIYNVPKKQLKKKSKQQPKTTD